MLAEWLREGAKLVVQWGALLPGPAQAVGARLHDPRWSGCVTLLLPGPRCLQAIPPHYLLPGKPIHPCVPACGLVQSRNSKRCWVNVN